MLIQEQKKKEDFMEIRVQAIHFDASEQLHAFIQKKVSKLDQYFDGILKAEVTLKVVKPETANNKQAGVKLLVRNGEWMYLLMVVIYIALLPAKCSTVMLSKVARMES